MSFIDPDSQPSSGGFVDPDSSEAPKGASSLPETKDESFSGLLKDAERWSRGGGEALLNLGTGIVGMFGGAGSILNEKIQGNPAKAEDVYADFIERNTYQPRTEEGKAVMGPINDLITGIGVPMAGIGRLPKHQIVGAKPLPPVLEKAAPVRETSVQKAIREARKEAEVPKQETLFVDPDGVASPELATKITEAPEIIALAKERARQLEMEAKGLSETMYAGRDGVASKELPVKIQEDAAVVDAVKRQQAGELQAVAKEAELPKNEQLDMFKDEQRAFDFEFGKADEVVTPRATPAEAIAAKLPEPMKQERWYTGSPEAIEKTRTLEEQSGRSNANEQKAGPGHYITMDRDTAGLYGGKKGTIYTVEKPFDNAFDFNKVVDGVSNQKRYDALVEQTGSRVEANKALQAQGFDAITFTDGRGVKIANIFNEKAVKADGPSRVQSTLSGPLELLPLEERAVPPDTIRAPTSVPMIEAKVAEQRKASILSKASPEASLREWLDVNTPQEALFLAKDAKDIGGGVVGTNARRAASGIHGVTITSGNNPVLKYVRKVFGDARAEATAFSQKYITSPETGLVAKIQKLTPEEKIQVVEWLLEGDRQQHKLNDVTLDVLKASDNAKAFVKSFQTTADAVHGMWNTARADLGFKPVPYREGWFPSIWKGGYKTLVTNAKGEKIGFIASDTKWQQAVAKKHYLEKSPGAQFSSMSRSNLGQSNKVDWFSGINDVLAILAKEDPAMAKLLEQSQEAQKLANNKLFSVGSHELQKKGISGFEGNKPWLDKKRNATDALKAMVDYFEQAAEHHSLQKPLHELDRMVKADETAHMPNTRKYLQEYANHVSGKTSEIGAAINAAIDIPFKLAGIGSRIPIRVANTIKAGMSRLYMGYYNPAFVGAQLAQPFQIAYPLAAMFAERLGLPTHHVSATMGRGMAWATSETLASILGDKVSIAPDYIKTAIQYAHDRGLYAFNELEAAQGATKNKAVRAHNTVADFMIGAGDRMTKLPTFLGFVELFKDAGLELELALKVAEKATETSMINYHPFERPMMYSKMGVVGQFAGGLTTYKHGSLTALASMAKEKGNKKPVALAAMAMLTFAGITGMVGYQEIDALYSKLSELVKGKPSSIREDFLQNLPEYVKSGVVSAASNLNMQAKWSAADMVPDSIGKAVSPHLEGASQIAIAAATYASDPSVVNRNNLLMKLTPSGMKGFTEEAVMKDDQGRVLGKDGLPKGSPRSESDWKKRKWAGVGLLNETIETQDVYKDRLAQTFKENQIKESTKKIKAAFIGKEFARMSKLIQEHEKLAGPESTQALLKSLAEGTALETQMTERQRLQGTPKSRSGAEKYQEYNDGN